MLFRSREKALVDVIEVRRNVALRSRRDMEKHLAEDLRIDEPELLGLDLGRVGRFAASYGTAKTSLLVDFLRSLQRRGQDE